jgi:hypothetical protein
MKTHIITITIIITSILIPYALGTAIQPLTHLKEGIILNYLYGVFTLGAISLIIFTYAYIHKEIKDLIK